MNNSRILGAALVLSAFSLVYVYLKSRNETPRRRSTFITTEPPRRPAKNPHGTDDYNKLFPNFPSSWYVDGHQKPPTGHNATCSKFPQLDDIEFNNYYWQTARTSNGTFQLFGAYWDQRLASTPVIRILAMVDRIELQTQTFCQMWYEKDTHVIPTRAKYYHMWLKVWGGYVQGSYQPYLVTCDVPEGFATKVPRSVSLLSQPCENATNNLKVVYNPTEKQKDFVVCVKGLAFEDDVTFRLVEWIELVRILGADKIVLYNLSVGPNISRLLWYYEEFGIVEVNPLSLAGGWPNVPFLRHQFFGKNLIAKRHSELVPYNDCFYRNMYEYRFVVLLDVDEVIVPKVGDWHDLMAKLLLGTEQKASYNVRNVYFIDEFLHNHGWFKNVPTYMHMLQHVYRTKEFTQEGAYIKSFHSTDHVVVLHNHYPLRCFEYCTNHAVDTDDAQLQHYREDCVREFKTCAELKKDVVQDTSLWKFKDTLVERCNYTLKNLGFIT